MSIIYLYIKQHSITGLKYFGKTKFKNPFKYLGSGKYWTRHISKHGKEYIKTLEIYGFDDYESCSEFALKFSTENNIVYSDDWANLKLENGLDGGSDKGRTFSEAYKRQRSEAYKGAGNPAFGKKRADVSARNKLPKKWITNGIHDKLILAENFEKYINSGWRIGRVNNNSRKNRSRL